MLRGCIYFLGGRPVDCPLGALVSTGWASASIVSQGSSRGNSPLYYYALRSRCTQRSFNLNLPASSVDTSSNAAQRILSFRFIYTSTDIFLLDSHPFLMMSAGRTSPSQQQAAGLQSAHLSGNNLSSNNPFRNRAASPSNLQVDSKGSSPSPFDDPPPRRPISRNPFLDQPTSLATTSKKPLSAEDIFVRIKTGAIASRDAARNFSRPLTFSCLFRTRCRLKIKKKCRPTGS